MRAGAAPIAECCHCTVVSVSLFLPSPRCLSISSTSYWVSPSPSPSRACSAALLAARQTLRLPLALCTLDPFSILIHHALVHHVMYLFGTSLPSHILPAIASSLLLSSCPRSLSLLCPFVPCSFLPLSSSSLDRRRQGAPPSLPVLSSSSVQSAHFTMRCSSCGSSSAALWPGV